MLADVKSATFPLPTQSPSNPFHPLSNLLSSPNPPFQIPETDFRGHLHTLPQSAGEYHPHAQRETTRPTHSDICASSGRLLCRCVGFLVVLVATHLGIFIFQVKLVFVLLRSTTKMVVWFLFPTPPTITTIFFSIISPPCLPPPSPSPFLSSPHCILNTPLSTHPLILIPTALLFQYNHRVRAEGVVEKQGEVE